MHVSRSRGLLFALPLLVCGCAAAPKGSVSAGPASSSAPQMGPGPQEGQWRVSGATNASFSNTDAGGADTTTFGLTATGGKMMTDNLLLEGVFEYSNSSVEAGNNETDSNRLDLGVGARYYFDTEGSTFPYARGLVGLSFIDIDGAGDDSSPFLALGVGAETFLTDAIALDYGLRYLYAFDIFDDELTDLALLVGFSFWF